jgi:hypothetical protein
MKTLNRSESMRLAAVSPALLCALLVAACSNDRTTSPTGNPPAAGDFQLARAGGSSLPVLDSGDSVDLHGRVEYREIYLEQGSLTLSSDAQPRFETSLHYAQYAVTVDASGQRHLELRAALDIHDHGLVHRDADGTLELESDVTPSTVHHATPEQGGYTLQYEQGAIAPPLVLFFRPALN